MPIIIEKRTRTAKRGTALAIAGGVLLVLLSLPLMLTLFPEGVRVKGHGVRAGFNKWKRRDIRGNSVRGFWASTTYPVMEPHKTIPGHYVMGASKAYIGGWGVCSFHVELW